MTRSNADSSLTQIVTSADRLSIGQVASLTGILPETLRKWEARYNFPLPLRTPKGQRQYTSVDVALIRKALQLQRDGYSLKNAINEIKLGQDDQTSLETVDDAAPHDVETVLRAVANFDLIVLDAIFDTAQSSGNMITVLENLVIPAMRVLGDNWDKSSAGIAEEHFLSSYVKSRMSSYFLRVNKEAKGPTIVCGCLPNELHELGLMFFAIHLVQAGYNVVYLGQGSPIEQVGEVAKKLDARAVVYSGNRLPLQEGLAKALSDYSLSLGIPVFLGGQASSTNFANENISNTLLLGTNQKQALQIFCSAIPLS